MTVNALHRQLTQKATEQGWQAYNWRDGLFRRCREDPEWLEEMFTKDEEVGETQLHEIVMAAWVRPDAWRVVVDRGVLVLEFLEIEVTGGIRRDKQVAYQELWWQFDGTMNYHFRVWHMDRFGVIRPYITNSPYFPGEDMGWG